MNLPQVFMYEGRQVRTVVINNEPHWIAKDVCEVLEIANHRDALTRLDEDEVVSTDVTDSLGRTQQMSAVTESGLYSLILGSKKQEAKPFKRWVTHEVLPTIRKTGSYSVQPQFQLPQTMPEALRMLAAEMESKAIMAADNDRLAIETAEQKQKLKEQEAPIAIYNLAINAQNTQSMQDTAKALGTGRTRLFDILRDAGVIIKGKTTPYQRYIDAGYFVVRVRPRASGESIVDDPVTRVTAKGFDYIARLMQKRAESNETQEAE